MLKSHLNAFPLTKFVLIEDSLEERGQPIFDFLIQTHLNRPQSRLHFFVFHGSFARARKRFEANSNTVVYDFTSNICGWETDKSTQTFESVTSKLSANDVVVVDSLAHTIFQYGLTHVYRVFNTLKQQSVSQIIVLLHSDLLDSKDKVGEIFEHLCTLSMIVEPKFASQNKRIRYTYKKLGGKIIKQIEEFSFIGDELVTKKIERLDPKKLLENSTSPQVNPETLSTFKIGLSEKDKESREKLVLPYLPKNDENGEGGGKIYYELEDIDDWDEEDPDDDLDI